MFTACLSHIGSPTVGRGPVASHYHVVDLVPAASAVGEHCNKVALWVLEASAWSHKAVRRREINQVVTISPPRAKCKIVQDMPCWRVHGTWPFVPVPCYNQHVSCGNSADCVLKVTIKEYLKLTTKFDKFPFWGLLTWQRLSKAGAYYTREVLFSN